VNLTIGGWNALGVLALIAIIAGFVLLLAYAARRGFVDRELDGTIESAEVPFSGPAPRPEAASRPRALGVAGAGLLVFGLALGLATAVLGWGSGTGASAGTRSGQPGNCAQSWNGCPQATQDVTGASPSTAP
jgi:hypothetical protein